MAHYPAATGLCKTCHDVDDQHLAGNGPAGATTKNVEQSCYSCHFRMDQNAHVHQALQETSSCASCHDAHGSDSRHFLKTSNIQNLCSQCHVLSDSQHKSVHGALDSKKSCLSCHDPHSSDHQKILNQPPKSLCTSCHQTMKDKIDHSPYVHGAMAGGDDSKSSCLSCHDSHAADQPRLLKEPYPLENYQEYHPATSQKANTYALCMKCHNPSMLDKSIAGPETRFRNDQIVNGKLVSQNLHWFHVVDAAGSSNKKSGRTCYLCHDPHAANQKFNIRDGWQMGPSGAFVTIEFSSTPKGGSCTKSCHDLRTYRRLGD